MTIALDIGVHRLRSLRCDGGKLVGRGCRTLHAVLPDSPARRQLLDQSAVPYAACEGNLVLLGDAAAEFAALFQTQPLPLLPGGKLPSDDPPARQILASLVELLIPRAQHAGEICCLLLPGKAGDRERDFFTRLVHLQGYTPRRLDAGLAVVLAELAPKAFTGIGISLGASSCEATLAHRGREVARCTVPHGGNQIDEQLARADRSAASRQSLDPHEVGRWKKTCAESIVEPATERGADLRDLYRQLVAELVATMVTTFAPLLAAQAVAPPLHVAVCGGTARAVGFSTLLQQALRAVEWPIPLGQVRIAADSDYTLARGGLIHAELESQQDAPTHQRAAA